MKRWIFKYYLFVPILLLINGALYAADLNVEVNTGLSYDSNVFQSSTDQQNDAYFTLAPRATLKIPLNRTYFSTALRPTLEQHMNRSDANLQELIFSGLGRYNPSEFISFGLMDEFIFSGRLRSAENLSDSTDRRKYIDNKVTSGVKYEIKPGVLITSLDYINSIRNYKNTNKDDWIGHSGNAQVEYIIGHLTSALLNVGLARKVYESDIDYYSFPVNAAIKRNLSSRVDSSLAIGFEKRQYNEKEKDLSWSKPTAVLTITGNFTPKTNSRLVLHRRVYDSDILNGIAFTSTAADLALVLDLKYNIKFGLQGLYSKNNYITVDRKDNVFNGKGTVSYNLSKLGSIVLGYGYERRTSVTSSIYNQHLVDVYYVVIF